MYCLYNTSVTKRISYTQYMEAPLLFKDLGDHSLSFERGRGSPLYFLKPIQANPKI